MPDLNNRYEHPDDFLIEEARMAADTDWAEEFVADIITRRNEWGGAFRLTDRQRAKLNQIAYGDPEGV